MVELLRLGALGSRTGMFASLMRSRASTAVAQLHGGGTANPIHGRVDFYAVPGGTLVVAEVYGLPDQQQAPGESAACTGSVHAFHIHEGGSCTGDEKDPFANAKKHFNPGDCPHPWHAGDMPPLLSNGGYAWSAFFTGRFHPEDVIGRTVIVHAGPDDFTTQPAGNAGAKIACGVIQRR